MEVIGKMQSELFACAAEKVNEQDDNLQYAGGQRADRRNAMPTISTLRRVASRICVIAKNR